ncbi:hypothetical protein Tco_0198920 [Tanacetum coccineum]
MRQGEHYEILDKKYLIIDWKTEYLGTKLQFDESKGLEEINLNVVTRSNGQKRYFSTLMRVISVFDREDLDANKMSLELTAMKKYNQVRNFTSTLQGYTLLITDKGLVFTDANREKYPIKEGNSGANAKAKIRV